MNKTVSKNVSPLTYVGDIEPKLPDQFLFIFWTYLIQLHLPNPF